MELKHWISDLQCVSRESHPDYSRKRYIKSPTCWPHQLHRGSLYDALPGWPTGFE